MIDRRNEGILNLHSWGSAVEAVALWIGMAALTGRVSFFTYYSLLPAWTYWVCIGGGVLLTTRYLARIDGSLVTLGWVGSVQLGVRQLLVAAGAIFTLAVVSKDVGLSRVFVAWYLGVFSLGSVIINRYQPIWLVRLFLPRWNKVPLLLVGNAENFPGLAHWLHSQRVLGFEPVGAVSYHGGLPGIDQVPAVGDFMDLEAAIDRSGAKQVLMLELPRSKTDAEHLARVCSARGCRLMIHNNLIVQLDRPLRALSHHGYSFLVLHDEPLENPLNRCIKRLLDLAISLPVVLLVLPPLAFVVAVAHLLQSRGPLFFTQQRTGRGGKLFRIWKFRTMHPQADGHQQAQASDSRVFPLGRFMRRTSLDEMPQFVNVLFGSMSVVGPRPHVEAHEAIFAASAEIYRMRWFVKPGITGLAQSRGLRGEAVLPAEIQERIHLDLVYIRSWSFWLDVAIILKTIGEVVSPPRSAY